MVWALLEVGVALVIDMGVEVTAFVHDGFKSGGSDCNVIDVLLKW